MMKTKNLFHSIANISSLRKSRSNKSGMLSGSAIAGLATLMFSASAHGQFSFSSSTTWQDFAVLSYSQFSNTGPSIVEGNVGLFPTLAITGFPPGMVVNGTVYSGPNPISREIARIAQTDAIAAYTDLQSAPTNINLTGTDLGIYNGVTALTPGVYEYATSAQLTGTLELDANVANSVFIFKIGSTLTTAPGSNVVIVGANADCAKVYWQVGSSATIDTSTEFVGNIFADISVSVLTSAAILNGSAFALNGAVTLDTNNVSYLDPTCISPIAFPMVTASMLTAEELTAIFQMGFSGAASQNLNIQRHLESVRRGGGSPPARPQAPYPNDSKSGMSDSKSGMSDSKSGMNDSKSGLVEQQVDSQGKERLWSAYLEANGAWSEVGEGASAYKFDTRGATLGIDRRFGDNFVFGILGSYDLLDANFSNSSSIEGESYKGALYGTYFNGGFFVDALLGAGTNSYDTSRSLGFLGIAEGSTDGWELDAMLNTGYDIHNGKWTFTPFASLAFTRMTLNGFTETGSTSPLIFPTQSQDSLRSDLGMKVAYSIAMDNGVVITPQMRLSWQHEYLDSTQSIDSSFVSAPGSPFTVNGPSIGRDRAVISAGLNVQLTPTVNIYAHYDGQLGSSDLKYNNATVGIMVEF